MATSFLLIDIGAVLSALGVICLVVAFTGNRKRWASIGAVILAAGLVLLFTSRLCVPWGGSGANGLRWEGNLCKQAWTMARGPSWWEMLQDPSQWR
jgi:cell division protein FtsW (lipid II flippase)